MPEWEKYAVGKKHGILFKDDCTPFEAVNHVCHVVSAIGIAQADGIQPSLVYDESRLNDSRILVSWLSPNYWHHGFRYGNISFSFPIQQLVADKHYFWVESIAYGIHAVRILITDIDRSDELEPYDPTIGNGPWYYDQAKGKHFFNGKYTLELMVEGSVPLEMLNDFSFVKHHGKMCSLNRNDPNSCPEIGLAEHEGGSRFLAIAAATGTSLHRLTPFVFKDAKPTYTIRNQLRAFMRHALEEVETEGNFAGDNLVSRATARAVLNAYAQGRNDEMEALLAEFAGDDAFLRAAAQLIGQCLGIAEWEALFEEMKKGEDLF